MKFLVLNGGSSSLKARIVDVSGAELPSRGPKPLWEARVDWGRHPGTGVVSIRTSSGGVLETTLQVDSPAAVIGPVLNTLWSGAVKVVNGPEAIDAVGHRIVHGGKTFVEAGRITAAMKAEIARLVQFAPEHNRLELELIEEAEHVLGPTVPQFAVFDTAFHATLPAAATVYPGPYAWLNDGIRRYGFHGISHQYTSRRAAEILGRDLKTLRLITCHLGNGCSLAAVREGRSLDTTMGFTPLEGLMMGTRSGSIDPGILIYLIRHCHYSAGDLDRILNQDSGLKGISGISSDMREILAASEAGNERAQLAFEIFAHRLCRETGAMLASLGGLDALVFAGGIGENCPQIREFVVTQFGFMNMKLDSVKNNGSPEDEDIAAAGSAARVLVIRTDEDWEIVRECWRLL